MIGGCRFATGTAEADLVGPIAYANRVIGGWGRAREMRMRKAFGRALSISAMGECLANVGSYIDLDPQAKDALGQPKARIHSHLDEAEIKRIAFMAKTAREILKASGVASLFEEYGAYDAFNATHVLGTCRMGADPATSVVDPFCRSHRWRNLYVIDASLFPSSGGGEGPSLTIQALAIRAAEHIAARQQRREH